MGSKDVSELDQPRIGVIWLMIRCLVDDPVYLAKYPQAHDLIAPYVEAEEEGFTQLESIESFNQALEQLSEHATQRYETVQEYLAEQ